MKKNRSTLISGVVLTLGLVCLAVGLIQSPPTLTAEAQASVTPSSLDSLGHSDQSKVKTQPIESLRVGDRVLAKNPEVSNSERRSWGEEPDWSTWKELSVEMPKEDGSTLHVEIIRPTEWLESQVGFVVAERSHPICHVGPEEGGTTERVGSLFRPTNSESSEIARPKKTPDPLASANEPNALASGLRANTLSTTENQTQPDTGSPQRLSVDQRNTFQDPRLGPTAQDVAPSTTLPDLPLLPRYSIVGLTVELDLAEMGAVGTGIVTDVTDCPEVKPGEGQVITATFRHPPSTDVLDVTFVDESTWLSGKGRESFSAENQTAGTERVGSLFRPDDSQSSKTGDPKKTPDPLVGTGTLAADSSFSLPPSSLDSIGVTDNHLFWSVDRQQFVPIGEMEIGERVQTYHGETKRIASKLPRPGPPKEVYNLEVYGEHVYFVGEHALLAHNSCVDSLIDNVVLVDAFEATRRTRQGLAVSAGQAHALSLVNSKKHRWIMDPNSIKEFYGVKNGGAARRRFLKQLQSRGRVHVMSGAEARAIATRASFQSNKTALTKIGNNISEGMGMRPNGARGHTNWHDQVHSLFAMELGINVVSRDRVFMRSIGQYYSKGLQKLNGKQLKKADRLPGIDLPWVHMNDVSP